MSEQVSASDVQRFLKGDESVLESLVRTVGPRIEAQLLGKYPTLRPFVEDLLAESLYKLWSHRESFDPEKGSLFTWWSRIAENAARDMLRAGWQRARGQETALDVDISGGSEPLDPSIGMATTEQTRAFWQEFNQLDERDRRILLYHAQVSGEGHWAAELSEELGLSAGAIRVRYLRAMQRLRKILGTRGFPIVVEE